MDTAQWHQNTVLKPKEEEIVTSSTCLKDSKVLKCPRCTSTNTKFCYYNNYSLSQPRYVCKTCRRYWTEGGSLRNIPVGGGSRKNKTSLISSSSTNSILSRKLPDLLPPSIAQQNPKIQESHDLNLGFSTPNDFRTINELIQVPNFENKELQYNPCSSSSTSTSSHDHFAVLELLNGINTTSRGALNSFMPNNSVYSSGFPLPELKSSLNFSLDGDGSNYGSFQGVQETNGKLNLFPFQDLKLQVSAEQNREAGDSNGFWNEMISK